MKFLLESLGMTSQCNLRCSYCDWEKDEFKELSNEELSNAKKHLQKMYDHICENYPNIGIVQYSGGEPFLYPKIIDYVLEIFHDKWIRINTNGMLIHEEQLNNIKQHGKVYIAISLDGKDIHSNRARLNDNEKALEKILMNVDKIVEKKIPLMLLCTLSKYNIDYFPEFVDFLEDKYKEAIEEGLLVLPTHSVTNYSKDNGVASGDSVDKFVEYIEKDIDKHIILKPIKKHYQGLCHYVKYHNRLEKCSISNWSLSMHFRKNELIDQGRFLSFGCGMRGVHELSLFNINSDKDMKDFIKKVDEYNFNKTKDNANKEIRFSEINKLDDNCEGKCFPDWVIFDLVLSGKVSIEEAANWFVLFRDSDIVEKITRYKKSRNII